ncbi:MAG: metallopeptidase family protein [Candidatus Nealsonbacteria bacterium]|nr:metallopeptidase family protein [Candidatus Nealsonbacteria bacterium]
MTIEKIEFEELVNEGIKAIPKRFLEKLNNIEIVIEDEPTPEQIRKLKLSKNSTIFGLYEGIPQTKRWHYGQVLPDKITIFKNPIEEIARSEEEIKEIVKNTVWHEIAHHFGFDEKRIRELEVQKKKKGQ